MLEPIAYEVRIHFEGAIRGTTLTWSELLTPEGTAPAGWSMHVDQGADSRRDEDRTRFYNVRIL